MRVSHGSPFMGPYADLWRVVTFDTVIGYLVGGAIGEDAEGFLQAAIDRINIDASNHVRWVMFGVLHDGLSHHGLMPRGGVTLGIDSAT